MTEEELLQAIEQGANDSVTKLDLSNEELKALPPKIEKPTNLQELDLSSNQLTTLPPEIGQLTNLQKLNLSGNQLIILPVEIGQLTNLQELDLSNNQLTTLPPELSQLSKLKIRCKRVYRCLSATTATLSRYNEGYNLQDNFAKAQSNSPIG